MLQAAFQQPTFSLVTVNNSSEYWNNALFFHKTKQNNHYLYVKISYQEMSLTLYDNELLLVDALGFTTTYNTRLTAVTKTEQMHNHVK